jgi:GT2 family glycosyltransferase
VRGLPTPAALALEALLLNRLWPRNPVNRRYRCLDLDGGQRAPVEQPAGAFLMIRRAVWEELGGFDEGFFPLWFEDVDFCRRVADRGYRIYYEPAAVAIHTGGHSIGSLSREQKRLYWYGSLLRYAAKHFRPVALRAVCAAVVTGSLLRGIGGFALGSVQSLAVYGKVARLACRYFLFGGRDGAWPRSGGIRRG